MSGTRITTDRPPLDESLGSSAGDSAARLDPRVLRTQKEVVETVRRMLLEEGAGAVTHQRVARAAGYSKATVYAHWPARTDLFRAALSGFADAEHSEPQGDLRSDLVRELRAFRTAMAAHRVDRALAVLAAEAAARPELTDVRERVVTRGERVIRELLHPVVPPERLDAATMTLCGAVCYYALMHGRLPGDELIEQIVDIAMGGLGLQ